MGKQRDYEILSNLLNWVVEHDDEFVIDAIKASGMTALELKEYDLDEYISKEDNEELAKRKRYLLNKMTCCSLDDDELDELDLLSDVQI